MGSESGNRGNEVSVSKAPQRVQVADLLPEFVERLDPEQQRLARRLLVTDMITLRRGAWHPAGITDYRPGHLGLLVLDGLITRDVILDRPLATELLGRGDLLRPIDHDGLNAPVAFDIGWNVLVPTRLAVLDPAFTRTLGHWPAATEALVRSAVTRTHSLALTLAVSHLRRVDTRVLVLMWHLADRWGRVRPDGVLVPLKLTHETLARLVGAQRPSVTTALRTLQLEGRLLRTEDRDWLLRGEPPTTRAGGGQLAAAR
jgi:hypothetical protein